MYFLGIPSTAKQRHSTCQSTESNATFSKRWHGSIPVLTHQLNPIIVQFLGGSLNSKIKDILHNLLIRELEVCRRIHHPNIMSLLAIIYDDAIQTESHDQLINPSSLVLTYELPSLGNLQEYIQVKVSYTL
ncbi:unnamed protein product [Trichobilharzia regenti]|nr:unnamed protein product [Trichobilharzia regenti]